MRTLASVISAAALHGALGLTVMAAGCGPKEEALDENPGGGGDDDDDGADACVDDDCPLGTVCDLDEASDTFDECIEGDRNNSPDEAVPVPLSEDLDNLQRVSEVISPAGDVDYFVYGSDGDEWVSIRTETDGGRDVLDTYVTVTGPDGNLHARLDNYPTGLVSAPLDTVLYTYLPFSGDYTIAVEDITTAEVYAEFFGEADWRGGAASSYSVHVRSAGAVVEPDAADDPATTILVDDGGTITALGVRMEDEGDVDHIGIEMDVGGEPVEVWVQPDRPASTALAQLDLYDDAGERVASKRAGTGDDGYLSYFDPAVGSYRLEASDAVGSFGPQAWYVVYVRTYDPDSFHPFFGTNVYTYETEPNDVEGEANVLSGTTEEPADGESYRSYRFEGRIDALGTTTTGAIDDVDRFVVTVPAGEQLSVRCFVDRFGSLLVPEVRLQQNGFDRTPEGQGSVPTDTDYYVHNALVEGTIDVEISAAIDSAVGVGAYYRCVAYVTPFVIDAGE